MFGFRTQNRMANRPANAFAYYSSWVLRYISPKKFFVKPLCPDWKAILNR